MFVAGVPRSYVQVLLQCHVARLASKCIHLFTGNIERVKKKQHQVKNEVVLLLLEEILYLHNHSKSFCASVTSEYIHSQEITATAERIQKQQQQVKNEAVLLLLEDETMDSIVQL